MQYKQAAAGIGTSTMLKEYGQRFWQNLITASLHIDCPTAPARQAQLASTVVTLCSKAVSTVEALLAFVIVMLL